jgi:hypothetical protein
MPETSITLEVKLPKLHPLQARFLKDFTKRNILRAGRRFGKTWLAADIAVERFLDGKRVLYAAPTTDQLEWFWTLVNRFLAEPIAAGIFLRNISRKVIQFPGDSNASIRAKTAWNADMLRGDYADLLILDEFQLMNESTWNTVGAPMLLDTGGDALFIYTPPSLRSRSASKAHDPRFVSRLFARAVQEVQNARNKGEPPRWQVLTATSFDNPYISREALDDIASDMTALAYRQEILAEDVEEAPGALWRREDIERHRVLRLPEAFDAVAIGVDPAATSAGDETGIVAVGVLADEYYVLGDYSLQGMPLEWASEVIKAYRLHDADKIVAEGNQGGEMVLQVIRDIDPQAPVQMVMARRSKAVRAEPVSVLYQQGKVHHVGSFPRLEDELCLWTPGDASPNRLDALVWAITYLMREGIFPSIY